MHTHQLNYMHNYFGQLVGIAAAALTTFAFLPQIIKVLRTRSAGDVSPVMLFQFSTGVALWAVYGVYLKDKIIIAANSITLVTLVVLLFLYFCYGRKKNEKSAGHRD